MTDWISYGPRRVPGKEPSVSDEALIVAPQASLRRPNTEETSLAGLPRSFAASASGPAHSRATGERLKNFHSNCDSDGTFVAYEVRLRPLRITRTHAQLESKKLWDQTLGWGSRMHATNVSRGVSSEVVLCTQESSGAEVAWLQAWPRGSRRLSPRGSNLALDAPTTGGGPGQRVVPADAHWR
jgi:hypothetical protein